jgi:acyl-homoserine-lactone acylase
MDQAPGEQTEILWDQWGVPHIFAPDNGNLFYALGWAQARSHGNLILRLYGQARGLGAEYWGEAYLPTDQWTRTMGVPQRAARWHEAQDGEWKQYLDAFAQGINDYAEEYPAQISDEVEAVLPIDGRDVLAHGQRVMLLSFVTSSALPRTINRRWNPGQNASLPATTPGSNGWAIGPSRSSSGNTLLLGNPHLPWSNLYLFYEAHLKTQEMDSYGSTLVGIPVAMEALLSVSRFLPSPLTITWAGLTPSTPMMGMTFMS